MSRQPGTVRETVPTDLPRLRAIQQETLAEPWPELLDVGLDGPVLSLVVETVRPVGYALVVPADDVAYLAEFVVAPDEQGQGYGSSLMRALVSRLASEGIESVRLTARADDARVRSFYENREFETVDVVPDHYEDGDAVVMERTL